MMQRMWINQPCPEDGWHEFDRTNVLAEKQTGLFGNTGSCRVYFLEGSCVSIRINRSALSNGWIVKE